MKKQLIDKKELRRMIKNDRAGVKAYLLAHKDAIKKLPVHFKNKIQDFLNAGEKDHGPALDALDKTLEPAGSEENAIDDQPESTDTNASQAVVNPA